MIRGSAYGDPQSSVDTVSIDKIRAQGLVGIYQVAPDFRIERDILSPDKPSAIEFRPDGSVSVAYTVNVSSYEYYTSMATSPSLPKPDDPGGGHSGPGDPWRAP